MALREVCEKCGKEYGVNEFENLYEIKITIQNKSTDYGFRYEIIVCEDCREAIKKDIETLTESINSVYENRGMLERKKWQQRCNEQVKDIPVNGSNQCESANTMPSL